MKVRRTFLHRFMPTGAIVLAVCFAAICCGLVVGNGMKEPLGQFASHALHTTVTVPNLLLSLIWPFCLVVPGAAMLGSWFCLPVCLAKSFCCGLCMGILLAYFGATGMLACLLLMTQDFGMLGVLLWYCCRRLCSHGSRSYGDLLVVVFAAGLLVLADRLLLSPFLAELFFW